MILFRRRLLSSIPLLTLVLLGLYFEWALVAFSTRSISIVSSSSSSSSKSISPSHHHIKHKSTNTKSFDHNGYVAFLPHSGFCNQRQALENALVIAYILNRTLILPPVYLGHSVSLSWRPFDELKKALESAEKTNYNRIYAYKSMPDFLMPLASSIPIITQIPYSTLFDFNSVGHMVKTIEIADFIALKHVTSANDILEIRDTERYSYKVTDGIEDNEYFVDLLTNNIHLRPRSPIDIPTADLNRKRFKLTHRFKNGTKMTIHLNQFSHLLDLSVLLDSKRSFLRRPPKLIQFGSLFGTTRLKLYHPENIKVAEEMRKLFEFRNPILTAISSKIVEMMGGPGAFSSVHLRIGDLNFAQKSKQTVKRAAREIRNMLRKDENLSIYIATDVETLFTNVEMFQEIHETGAKLFTLQNFTRETREFKEMLLEYRDEMLKQKYSGWLSEMRSLIAYENLYLQEPTRLKIDYQFSEEWYRKMLESKYKNKDDFVKDSFGEMWIPFLEQLICSRGREFKGTGGSTFTLFIQLLHEIYWGNKKN